MIVNPCEPSLEAQRSTTLDVDMDTPPQVDSAAPDPEVDHVAAEAHRASDGAAASLPRRGGHLHPPATVAGAAAQGHHAGVHGVCSGVTPSLQHRPASPPPPSKGVYHAFAELAS